MGITVVPQDGNGIDDSFDLAVFSTAVERGHAEAIRAGSLGLPVKTRPEYLADITRSFNTIAVAGTSGKSTASGLLAFLMKRLGLEPNFLGGGRVKQFKSFSNPGNFLTGNSSRLVIEACESDGTIVNYAPEYTIILNLELDHHTIDKTARMFELLIRNTRGKIFINADDGNLNEILTGDAITFSVYKSSHYKAEGITYHPFSTDFSINGTRFSLSLPGEYNLYNALSCIALLSETGIPHDMIASALPDFKGIERRFDIHLNDGNKLVIDDYAHNPHKIFSLMKTVKKLKEKICYIFQPHGFGPTRLMKNEYITAFSENLRDADHLILLPIYYAGGTASKDISSYDLADGISAYGRSVEVARSREDILKRVHEHKTYIIFGARDETLSGFAKELSEALQKVAMSAD